LVSSANGTDFEITAGVSLFISKLCVDINNVADTLFLLEDITTDITVSIDSAINQNPITEFPELINASISRKECECAIELISGSESQTLACFEEIDTIVYLVEHCQDITVSGLSGNLNYTFNNGILEIFGSLSQTGPLTIIIEGDTGCFCDREINFEVDTGTAIMIDNRCYLSFQLAVDDYSPGELIEIKADATTYPPMPVLDQINVRVNEGVTWYLSN
jgi:hypothetical protein